MKKARTMKSNLRWSATQPSRPGWYMWRQAPGSPALPVKVFHNGDGELSVQAWGDIGWFRIGRLAGQFAFVAKVSLDLTEFLEQTIEFICAACWEAFRFDEPGE